MGIHKQVYTAPYQITQALNGHIHSAKLKQPVTLHCFRHTVTSTLVQSGMPIRYVQLLLGHESPESTLVYVRLDVGGLVREVNKRHPRG